MSLHKSFSKTQVISTPLAPENSFFFRNPSPVNLSNMKSSITLPKHCKNSLSSNSPYEAPLFIKQTKPKIKIRQKSDFNYSFNEKLKRENRSLNSSVLKDSIIQTGDHTDSTLSSIDKSREIQYLEYRICDKIKNSSPMDLEKFKCFQGVFEELILISNPLTKILVKIKKGYEE